VSHQHILTDVSDGIGTLTLNRPEKLNAYTTEMGEEVTAVLRGWREDAAVRAVILTGAGRGFCAGVDLEHLAAHQAGGNVSQGPRLGEEDFLRKLPLELVAYPKPLVAAVNGAAIGVGVTMILPFDVRIASENAKLGLAFVKLGILPGLGSTHLLPRLVGRAKALELVLSARTLSAPEALAIGLVNAVVPAEKLLPAARELAAAIAAHGPEVVTAAKAAVNYGAEHTLEEAMRNEERASAELRKQKG
jgi:2-(1,2-epoxy-1,2-dihydrophenyl)acetyl-CoA isomerase